MDPPDSIPPLEIPPTIFTDPPEDLDSPDPPSTNTDPPTPSLPEPLRIVTSPPLIPDPLSIDKEPPTLLTSDDDLFSTLPASTDMSDPRGVALLLPDIIVIPPAGPD
jgi:hypothetical protein